MSHIWDYLLAVRIRYDKASVKVIETAEQSQSWLDFINCAHQDVGNLLALVYELRQQRNDAFRFNDHYTEAGEQMAIEVADKRLQALITIKQDNNNEG